MASPGEVLHSINLIDCQSGEVVKGADVLRGKVTALVIGPFWLPKPLAETIASFSGYVDEIREEKKHVQCVYVPLPRNERQIEEMKEYGNTEYLDESPDLDCFNKLIKQFVPGWLSVPLGDHAKIRAEYPEEAFCGFVFVGEDGEIITTDGLKRMRRWGAQGFPYSDQRIAELEKQEVERRANQTLESLLVTPNRDFVIKNDGTQVKVDSFKGKIVGLFFTGVWRWSCWRFAQQLIEVYRRLGGNLEVVMVSQDRDEASFVEQHKKMPWLAVPYSDAKHRKQLKVWFNVKFVPGLVFLDECGKIVEKYGSTSTTDDAYGVHLVYTYGAAAFPFSPGRIAVLQGFDHACRAMQSIETLLVRNNRDYLLAPGGSKVEVKKLVGKTVGLFFGADWSWPSQSLALFLGTVYEELKRQRKEFEVVFISCDRDEEDCMNFYKSKHGEWLVVPFSDRPTKCQLYNYFSVNSVPKLVIIGPDGKTVTRNGYKVVFKYKALGFPYTQERLATIDASGSAMKMKMGRHTLLLQDGSLECVACGGKGDGLVYRCKVCNYDFHPRCAKAEIEAAQGVANGNAKACPGLRRKMGKRASKGRR